MTQRCSLALAILLLLQIPAVSVTAQSEDEPKPYEREEFPQWLHDLRRAEVVYIGSFPLSMLFASLGYEAFRGVRNAIVSAPVEERSEFGSFTLKERRALLVSGLAVSGAVTLIDLFIELRGRRRAEQNEDRESGTAVDRGEAAASDAR